MAVGDMSIKAMVHTKAHTSVESLKKAIKREWAKIPQEDIKSEIFGGTKRLQPCVKANGGHFEC